MPPSRYGRGRFPPASKLAGIPEFSMKRYALHLYLEGLGFRSIGRILGVSNVSILKWIRAFGKQAEDIRSERHLDVVEMDELHTYIGQKNAIAGYGLLLIDMGKGSSTSCWVTAA